MTTSSRAAVDQVIQELRGTCILGMREERMIEDALREMYDTGASDRPGRPEACDDESPLVSVERLAESLMMRLRRNALLGISCQVAIKEQLVAMYHAGAARQGERGGVGDE